MRIDGIKYALIFSLCAICSMRTHRRQNSGCHMVHFIAYIVCVKQSNNTPTNTGERSQSQRTPKSNKIWRSSFGFRFVILQSLTLFCFSLVRPPPRPIHPSFSCFSHYFHFVVVLACSRYKPFPLCAMFRFKIIAFRKAWCTSFCRLELQLTRLAHRWGNVLSALFSCWLVIFGCASPPSAFSFAKFPCPKYATWIYDDTHCSVDNRIYFHSICDTMQQTHRQQKSIRIGAHQLYCTIRNWGTERMQCSRFILHVCLFTGVPFLILSLIGHL